MTPRNTMARLTLGGVAFTSIFVILLAGSPVDRYTPPLVQENETIANGIRETNNVPYYHLPYNNEQLPYDFRPLYEAQKTKSLTGKPLADELNYRLPNNTEPIHYDIELSTNVHTGNRTFTGKVAIQIRVLKDTRSIVIHARQLKDFKATIRKDNCQTFYALDYAYENERDFLSFKPRDVNLNLKKGEIWILTIEYSGTLRTDNAGFYLSTYKDENNNVRNLATTHFESTDARHGFPCYDEPAKRATFTITIRHDPSYHAISNMPVNTKRSSSGLTVFQKTVNIPTYLVAFIVSDFVFTKAECDSITQRVFSRPGTEKDQEFALVSGMLFLRKLSQYFGMDFALPKIDQVAVPDFAGGAMENWGLFTYEEKTLLYNKENSTVFTQTTIATTIAHEFSHQWLGNIVTLKWWSYLWLKEGFATLFAIEAINMIYPDWDMYQAFHIDTFQVALHNDADIDSRPMTYYVQTPNSISEIIDTVSYDKAASVLSMWQHALTDTVFRQGLHNYLESNKFGAAEENDLFEGIQTAVDDKNYKLPATIQQMMSSWTRQGGCPILNITRNYDNGSFTLYQKPFYANASHNGDQTWYIPFNFATKSNPDFRDTSATHFVLKTKEVLVNDVKISSNDWLLLNKQSTGFYPINYDEKNWGLIAQGLLEKPSKFHPRNRAQLMYDAYLLSMTDRLKESVLMNLLKYLKNEDQYAPWSTANHILTKFNFYLSGDSNYNDFKEFVAGLVGNIYKKLGANDVEGEQHNQKFTRPIVINLACMTGIESCLRETNNKLINFIDRGTKIEPNVEPEIYCNGLKQSSDNVFDFFYNKLMSSTVKKQRLKLISYLACSLKHSQIMKLIETSIDMNNNLETSERSALLSSTYARGEVGLYACINFLKENWEAYDNSSFNLNSDIEEMARYVVSTEQEKALLELVHLVKDSDFVSETLEQSVKSNINVNFDWINIHRSPIMNYLSNY